MKQKFLQLVLHFLKPWRDGASGTPWSFTTKDLVFFGNESLPSDTMVDEKGEITTIFLTAEEVVEVMEELGYNKACMVDTLSGLKLLWEVELLPTMTL